MISSCLPNRCFGIETFAEHSRCYLHFGIWATDEDGRDQREEERGFNVNGPRANSIYFTSNLIEGSCRRVCKAAAAGKFLANGFIGH